MRRWRELRAMVIALAIFIASANEDGARGPSHRSSGHLGER